MKAKLRLWTVATLWFASVSGLSTYGVILAREAEREKRYGLWGDSYAFQALRNYLGAQGVFQRKDRYGKGKLLYANPIDGKGLADLYRVGGPLEYPDGTELKLIDLAFARATSPETSKAGYWFVEITGDALGGHYDYATDCGLCALPAEHSKMGLYTFIINIEGTVYKKDNGGTPVTVWPDVVKDGWLPVGY